MEPLMAGRRPLAHWQAVFLWDFSVVVSYLVSRIHLFSCRPEADAPPHMKVRRAHLESLNLCRLTAADS